MIIKNIEQRSKDWIEWRRKRVTASDAPALCGVDQYNSPYKIWLDKIGIGKPVPVNEDMQRGIDNEGRALELLIKKTGIKFVPAVVESEKFNWLGASLDGIHQHVICEIKSPRYEGHKAATTGMIPSRYMIQMQTQLLVTEAELCFFCSYFNGEIEVIEVYPDLTAQEMIIADTGSFWKDNVLGFTAPELRPGDFIEREDIYFSLASERWKELQRRKKVLEQEEEALRKEFTLLTNGENSRGFGVSVTTYPRRGNIEYKAIPELQDVDLEKYRKAPINVTTIRCA